VLFVRINTAYQLHLAIVIILCHHIMFKSLFIFIRISRYVKFTYGSQLTLFLNRILPNCYHMWLNENIKSGEKKVRTVRKRSFDYQQKRGYR